MKLLQPNYEYAGFFYSMARDEDGRITARAHQGQHPAALKDKNRRGAVEQWEQELK